jgi:hypothetical protein
MNFRNIYEKTEEVYSLLETAGINIHPQCRFYQFKRNLLRDMQEDKHSEVRVDEDTFSKEIDFTKILSRVSTLGQGLRDFFELWVIVSSKTILKTNVNELRLIFGGNVDQYEDSLNNTRPRDLQYQLFLTAIFDLSGHKIRSTEPDFIFTYMDTEYSTACKRVNSPSKLLKRIKEAERQIELSGKRGFIALSLDRLVGLNFYSATTDPDRLRRDAEEMALSIFQSHLPKLPELKKSTLGIIVNLCMLGTDILTDKINFEYSNKFLILNQGDEDANKKLFELAYSIKLSQTKLL